MDVRKNSNKKVVLTQRQLCDLELILNKGFAPLSGFMGEQDYQSVLNHCTLADNTVWPMPITLDVNQAMADSIDLGETINLTDIEGHIIATLQVSDKWRPEKLVEAQSVFGTTDETHPGVNYLLNIAEEIYLGGVVSKVKMPVHYDYSQLRFTPDNLKAFFKENDWTKVIGFQTRNPMHRAHLELTLQAAKQIDGHVLIHPVVGMTKPHDIDHYTRVRCYQKILRHYPAGKAILSLLPLAMRMGGPREALWHAIIRKNYGCTHFIVGRDHAGPGNDKNGNPFYDPYAAQDIVTQYEDRIGIKMIPFQAMAYVKERQLYLPADKVKANETVLNVSGTELRRRLKTGESIPSWFSYPDVIEELYKTYPPASKQGITLFFTGLSGAGKSTIANAVAARLMAIGGRSVTLLDGDVVRTHLSSELGFSKEHRDLNVQRIGYVASEITKAGGIAICAAISPYASMRQVARDLVESVGSFVEIFVSTSLAVCEERDPKGLYAKVRTGEIKNFTGVDDPYEKPEHAEMTIDTGQCSVQEAVDCIVEKLTLLGCINTQSETEKDVVEA